MKGRRRRVKSSGRFGNFVVGGNYTVGLVVFTILVIINFVVITKGAGRVAEVAARFTLDAMPGKQMAIDADLNAGLINDKEARQRRKSPRKPISTERWTVRSKFVRGDAVAAVVITLVNILGGLTIGVLQQGMSLSAAAQTYTLLTVGEGLVAQVPALIIDRRRYRHHLAAPPRSTSGFEVTRPGPHFAKGHRDGLRHSPRHGTGSRIAASRVFGTRQPDRLDGPPNPMSSKRCRRAT